MSNTRRIAKNTIVLYVRMIIVLLITLYSSRIVLKALGVDDFGLYNVVGGIVGLLTFFNGTMSKSTQRFLNIAMVKGDQSLKSIFVSSITIHLIIAFVFFIIGETLGLWFLNSKANIPENRELAANFIYHTTVSSFCISIITIPYRAAVIAYEKMSFLAIVSVVDALLKLFIAFMLLENSSDRLVIYGFLLFGVTIINFVLYYIYCKKNYPILEFKIKYNNENFAQIFSFISWTFLGQMAVMGCNQGNVVLVNMFHPLAANAAMSVGSQVGNSINNLTTNFQTAFNPQITKSFAEKNYDYLQKLVYTTSKISFCVMFAIALPLAFNIDWVLKLWLDTIPHLSNTFAVLFLVNGIVNAISMPFNFTILSSGNIKNFQIVTAVVFLLDLPVTYLLFNFGMPATTVLWVKIGVISVMFFVRVYYASLVVQTISFISVCVSVLLPMLIVSGLSILLCIFFITIAYTQWIRIVITIVIEFAFFIMVWFICLSKNERTSFVNILKNIRKNRKIG